MNTPSTPPGSSLRNDLLQLYRELDAEIAQHQPVCHSSGRCCRFKEYGHTLFVSQPEADLLCEPGLPAGSQVSPDDCPYQIENRCTARDRRPMGCRIYFCDPAFQDAQGPISEKYIARLKQIHDAWNEPWRYRPLVEFLRECSPPAAGDAPTTKLVLLGEIS